MHESFVHGPLSVAFDDTYDGRDEINEIQTIGLTRILGQKINLQIIWVHYKRL
jgi:hypothetical protein